MSTKLSWQSTQQKKISISGTNRERTISTTGCGLFSDFLMHLGRLLLVAAVFNSVDDFHGIEWTRQRGRLSAPRAAHHHLRGQKKKEKESPAKEPRMFGSHSEV